MTKIVSAILATALLESSCDSLLDSVSADVDNVT